MRRKIDCLVGVLMGLLLIVGRYRGDVQAAR
jgi:hypothetical protein